MIIFIGLADESLNELSKILVGLILKLRTLEFIPKNYTGFRISAQAEFIEGFGH